MVSNLIYKRDGHFSSDELENQYEKVLFKDARVITLMEDNFNGCFYSDGDPFVYFTNYMKKNQKLVIPVITFNGVNVTQNYNVMLTLQVPSGMCKNSLTSKISNLLVQDLIEWRDRNKHLKPSALKEYSLIHNPQ